MLPTSHQKSYRKLLNILLELQEQVSSPNSRVTAISEKFSQVQKVFQEDVLPLTSDELEEAIASRFLSVQREIHRNLRLLETDLMFLRSSKQAATTEQRLKIIRDRVARACEFCQVMLT
jgi:hypothetical protein